MALIDIISKKQLFVDDYLIESMSNCAQVLNRAEKVVDNPVLRPEHPWEGRDVSVENVRWDDDAGQFEMRYTTTQWIVKRGDGEVIVEGECETILVSVPVVLIPIRCRGFDSLQS